ncbi:2-keto-4-pentenoate hydratase/2-oxohepta-3-ene-1,7-dioic acid hydratase (catechol pathway) [Variovorax sp. YR752]|uniref:fumarylacetoacetate hydrolase family protein n=1 Tax=unclassified Variovorax TaxID=663243 RepID=UPI000BD8E63F|nr:fumarylacetoacetate hydrolase family protein [Variovorax sp. YR752]SOE06172.1 2-keto-4-pentenoate hydratase/2-oxohepta-3-ene-1,7-dioic acid hydratase (catechol pathway) [Variovorax sp. YR752]
MKFISYRLAGEASYGMLRGASEVIDLRKRLGSQAGTLKALIETGEAAALASAHAGALADHTLSHLELLPPIADPKTIACVGHNYEAHRVETQRDPTAHPSIFLRGSESLQAAGEPLLRPVESTQLDYEGELAIVIGKKGRRISEADAWDHIFGVSCFNDASVRDWQHHTRQFTPGKNFPRTGGFGPFLVTLDELPEDRTLDLRTRVNGQQVQHARTDQMIFPIPVLVNYISTFVTLVPGDVIVTGTPGGVGVKRTPPLWLQPGDHVEVEISSVGLLKNGVVAEE